MKKLQSYHLNVQEMNTLEMKALNGGVSNEVLGFIAAAIVFANPLIGSVLLVDKLVDITEGAISTLKKAVFERPS